MAATRAEVGAIPAGDRLARGAERFLRVAGDGRVGLVLLAATGLVNVLAALLPGGPRLLDGLPYALLLGALALSGVAAVAVRAPAAWREWQRPGPVQPGAGALEASLPSSEPEVLLAALARAGYRTRLESARGGRWAIHGVRRGWSRFAGILSHLALVAIVLGAAIGAAFGAESIFTLLPGDQALLDVPRPGFSAAVRLDGFEAEFGPDDRPRRLDTEVTFLRDGAPAREQILRVNEPGDFDGYLVHPWTYGPAARLRVTTLGGSALLDATLPLEEVRDGIPVGSTELPSVGLALGLALTGAEANELGVSVLDGSGLVDAARLLPGQSARIGDLEVRFEGFTAWVTFLSRSDPGLWILFGGGALLVVTLAVAFWLPRRRVTIRPAPAGGVRLVIRGERFDRPSDELARLTERLGGAG
jgi:cytochrome c biogenesis protein